MNKNPIRLHLSALVIILAASLLIWLNQHAHRRTTEAGLQVPRKKVEVAQLQAAAAAAKESTLRAAIEQSSKDVHAKIAALARDQLEQEQSARGNELATPAELPYRWDDAVNTVRLGKRVMTSLGLKPIQATEDGRFQLDDKVATLLSMLPTEVAGVQSAIDILVTQQRTIERNHLEITPGTLNPQDQWMADSYPDLVLSFSLPAFPEEADSIETAFRFALEQSIGLSRSEMFLSMAANELSVDFGDFGKLPRWITFCEGLRPDGMLMFAQFYGGPNHHLSLMSAIDPQQLATTDATPIPAGWRDLVAGYYYRGMSLDLQNSN